MPVELHEGSLRVSGAGLSLDARRKSALAFVSHAHADHIARHVMTLATPETLSLTQHRVGAADSTVALPFGATHQLGRFTLQTLRAGHMLGAAQLLVTRDDGHRLVYTGDFSPAASMTAGAAEPVRCDTLVMEATFGEPRFAFPPRGRVFDEVAEWARRQFSLGRRPILLGYAMGKSQEMVAQLNARGFKVCVDPQIDAVNSIYRQHGVSLEARPYDGTFLEGEVGVFPPLSREQEARFAEPVSTAVLTGWAMELGAARRYGADIAFPVSDHADYPALLKFAVESGAREVILFCGPTDSFARALRKAGVFARSLGTGMQMSLPLTA